MDRSQQNNDWKTSPDALNIQDSVEKAGISRFINRLHATSTIYLIAGCSQALLGLLIIVVSVLGFIRPLWLSAMLTAISSLTTMAGFFLVYHTITKMHDPNLLVRNAMKRVMESKN